MKAFGSLDEMYEDLGRVAQLKLRGAGTLAQRLTEHREAVFLSRRLTRIACDLQLGIGIEGLRRRLPDMSALRDFTIIWASDHSCDARANGLRNCPSPNLS